jgi:hypothetical protein
MSGSVEWPDYQAGPRESIFALGVVSVNYAKLEYALSLLFGIILGLDQEVSLQTIAKVKNHETIRYLMSLALPKTAWPAHAQDAVAHFLSGFKLCADNRNLLMHSSIIGAEAVTVLYKRNSKGEMSVCRPTVTELRSTADDIQSYCNYGINLFNAIGVRLDDWIEKPVLPFPWPNKPPLPQLLAYTTDY